MYKSFSKKIVAILLCLVMLFSVIPAFSVAVAADGLSYKTEQLNAQPWGSCEDELSTPQNKEAQDNWWNEVGSKREGSSLLLNMWNLEGDDGFIHHVKSTLEGVGDAATLWYDVYGRLTFDINLDDTAESFELLPGWGLYSYCTVLAQKPGDDKWYIVGRVLDEQSAGQTVFSNDSLGLTADVIKNTYKFILANDNPEKMIRLQFIPDNEYGVKPDYNEGKISIANIVYKVGIGDGVIDESEYTAPHFYNAADYPLVRKFMIGDSNLDKDLDILDLIALKNSLLSKENFDVVKDMDKDGFVNSVDFTALKKNVWDDTVNPVRTYSFDVKVTQYGAKGDGVTNDRAAIQAAIDAANAAGGGTVRLDAGKTFISGNIRIRSNVKLLFEDGSTLRQSGNPNDFVDVLNGYTPFELTYGLYLDLSIEWNAAAFYNYPFVLVPEGTENFKITGNGTIRMDKGNLGSGKEITMQVMGLYKASNFEISNISIREYHAFCIKTVSCMNGLYKNLTIDNSEGTLGGTDGIALSGSKNIRVTGCTLNTGDDGVYLCSSYNDPRERLWYTNNYPYPCENIEIDNNHNNVLWDETKAFCFIMWGAEFPDLRQVEANNVYIHDNYFETIGAWTGHWNKQTGKFEYSGKCNPIKNIRFENNTIGTIQGSFYSLPISDFYTSGNKMENGKAVSFDSMTSMRNTDFSNKDIYWVSRNGSSAGEENGYGYIKNLDKVDAALYQGVTLAGNQTYNFTANVKTSGDPVRLFVKDQKTGDLIASKECTATDWQKTTFSFTTPKNGTYRIGIERGNATGGYAYIDDVYCNVMVSDAAGEPDGQTVFSMSQTPDASGGGGLRNALGMKFGVKTSGTISKVRLYTMIDEGGEHLVTIWNYDTGELLTEKFYSWNIVAGYEGWREYTLPKSVKVVPNTTYVISITAGEDSIFAKGTNGLANAIDGQYIYTFANGGLYSSNAYNSTTTMPDAAAASNYFRDIVFTPDHVIEPEPEPEPDYNIAGTPDGYTVFSTSDTPAEYTGAGSIRTALGMKFSVKTSGKITKVRIYTGASETGAHYVGIWNYTTGERLTEDVFAWDITAGYEGWREYILPTPISVVPDTVYVVSVSSGSDGSFAKRANGLATALNNDYIYTYDNGALYSSNGYTATYAMPDASAGSNYFRDIDFVPDQPITPEPEPENTYSVFTTETPSEVSGAGSMRTGLGMRFGVNTSGKITKIRVYATAQETGDHYVSLWNYTTGALLTEQVYVWNFTAEKAGWVEYTLPTPVNVEPNTVYVVSATAGSDGSFSKQAGGLATALNSEYLYTFANSGMYTSNGYTATYAMPESSAGSNYFRDVVFVPDQTITPEPEPVVTNTVFTTETPSEVSGAGSMRTGLGMRFGVTTTGKITKIRVYATAQETGDHYVSLWNYTTGDLLTEQIYVWNFTAEKAGWVEYTLPTPVSVEPNTVYVVSATAGSDGSFSKQAGGLASALTNGYLYTFANSGMYTSNGYTATYAMPESSAGSNYFRDVEFVPDSSDTVTPTADYAITETAITTYGRTYYADNALHFNWSMSGFAFEINGTDAFADFVITKSRDRNVYVNVYVDGATEAYKTICLTKNGIYELASGLSAGKHTIKVVKRSEGQIGTAAVKALGTSGTITNNPPKAAEMTIEVIGDSITAGFGNLVTDGSGSGTHTSYEQDGTRTYATYAAQQLGAEVSVLGASGIGSLFIGNGPDCVMQDIYPYVDGLNLDRTTKFDFTNNGADVVVIGLGTNDVGHGSDSQVIAAAEEMINMVRQYNPNAKIIWAYGMMIDTDSDLFEQAVANVKAKGDNNVYYLQLPLMNASTDGVGAGSHPSIATHEKAGEVLANFIAGIIA